MVDYSQFEASTKSGITAQLSHIKKHDEIICAVLRQRRNSIRNLAVCIILTIASIFVSWIPAVIFGLAAAFFLWRFWGTGVSDEYMKEVYEEGLLVPGMVVKTQPLTIMAVANMVAHDGAATVNGCLNLIVKDLPGANRELYEKIPCSCFFTYEQGNYHSSFSPHPLYWGTSDQHEIAMALRQAESDNKENSQDEWEVIKHLAEQFPSLENKEIILLDENYVPFGIKKDYDSGYRPLNLDTAKGECSNTLLGRRFDGNNQDNKDEIPYLAQDIPGKDIYNKMIESACRHNVYSYICGHCETGRFINATHPGLYTYIGDSEAFLQDFHESKISLSEGELPLIFQKYLITTKGCYEEGALLPWEQINFSVQFNSLDYGMKLYLNGKKIAEFVTHYDDYPDFENMSKFERQMAAQIEAQHLLGFLQELKNLQYS